MRQELREEKTAVLSRRGLMNTEEVALYAGVKPQTVRTAAFYGKLPKSGDTDGRRTLYRREDVDAWLANRKGPLYNGARGHRTAEFTVIDGRKYITVAQAAERLTERARKIDPKALPYTFDSIHARRKEDLGVIETGLGWLCDMEKIDTLPLRAHRAPRPDVVERAAAIRRDKQAV